MVRLILVVWTALTACNGFAEAVIPTADKPGSRDSALLKRYEGSFIVAYEHQSFTDFVLPLSRLEPVKGKVDSHNNVLYSPKQSRPLEGAYTRLVYLLPAQRSPLEVLRNYQQEIKSKGGSILFECKAGECGGDPGRSSNGGGGAMSLAMFLYPEERIKDANFSNGQCAMASSIDDQRYTAAELPAVGAHVSVLTYSLKDTLYCKAFNGRTIVLVDIIEGKPREQNMVSLSAEEMSKQIATAGSVALYGIYFDFNKADIKPESDASLVQIAKLLRDTPALKLFVVGHTDNVGSLASNMELSQRRAAAVVNALVTGYQIDRGRLVALGVAQAAPVASNKTEAGRAKNRRVELVEN